jgi:hypothetical protein
LVRQHAGIACVFTGGIMRATGLLTAVRVCYLLLLLLFLLLLLLLLLPHYHSP